VQIYDSIVDLSRKALTPSITIGYVKTQSLQKEPLALRGEAGKGSLVEPGNNRSRNTFRIGAPSGPFAALREKCLSVLDSENSRYCS
jgi:hypothetical protein